MYRKLCILFDWSFAEGLSHEYKIVLAGGLNSRNVREAIKTVKPFIVDVSSGVENQFSKDKRLTEEFINNVKLTD